MAELSLRQDLHDWVSISPCQRAGWHPCSFRAEVQQPEALKGPLPSQIRGRTSTGRDANGADGRGHQAQGSLILDQRGDDRRLLSPGWATAPAVPWPG